MSFSSQDDFCLKWNDHHSAFFSNAEDLCANSALCDVTLCAGNKEFAAHKLVLAVSSNYFANIFTRRQVQVGKNMPYMPTQAVIYLKDVDATHMELILQYMYRGEITVSEENLQGLLNTAKGLRIKGLTEAGEDGATATAAAAKPVDMGKGRRRMIHVTPTVDVKRIKEEGDEEDPEIVEGPFAGTSAVQPGVGRSGRAAKRRKIRATRDLNEDDEFVIEGGMDYEHEVEQPEYDDDDYTTGEEVATVNTHNKLAFINDLTCLVCGRVFADKWGVIRHMNVHTGEKPFKCWYCDYATDRNTSLKSHCIRKHEMEEFEYYEKMREVKEGMRSKKREVKEEIKGAKKTPEVTKKPETAKTSESAKTPEKAAVKTPEKTMKQIKSEKK